MPIKRLDPENMVKFKGLHQTARAGNTVYISGQVAVDQQGNLQGQGSIEKQLEQVFKNLENACKAHGGSLNNLVKTTTFIIDRAHFPAVSAFRQKLYGANAPANTTVIVAGLARPEWWIEIEGVAVID